MIVQADVKIVLITVAVLATLALPGLHVHRQYLSRSNGKLRAAFVILVGPSAEGGENRTRGLEVALHALWNNYLEVRHHSWPASHIGSPRNHPTHRVQAP